MVPGGAHRVERDTSTYTDAALALPNAEAAARSVPRRDKKERPSNRLMTPPPSGDGAFRGDYSAGGGRNVTHAGLCPPIACLIRPTITIRMPPPTPPEAI